MATDVLRASLGDSALEGLADQIVGVDGLFLGATRVGAGVSLEDVAQNGLLICSALQARDDVASDAGVGSSRTESALSRLERMVQAAVIAEREGLASCFGRTFSLTGARKNAIGFYGQHIVANFAILVPNRLSPSVEHAKASLWNLEQARSAKIDNLFHERGDREFALLLHTVSEDDPQFSDKQVANVQAAAQELEQEADKQELRCRKMTSPLHMAQHLLSREAA